jgi:hypothetical protein
MSDPAARQREQSAATMAAPASGELTSGGVALPAGVAITARGLRGSR